MISAKKVRCRARGEISFAVLIIFVLFFSCSSSKSSKKSVEIEIKNPFAEKVLGIGIKIPLEPSKLCVSTHINPFSEAQNIEKELDTIKEAGFEMIRKDILWLDIEPEENRINQNALEKYRFLFTKAKQRGIDIIGILDYGNWWASDSSLNCTQECIEKGGETQSCKSVCSFFIPDPQKFAKFAETVSREIPEVQRFEIWNEPNWIIFMNPPNPSSYAELFISARNRIKNEKNEVFTGGLMMIRPSGIPSNVIFPWNEFLGELKVRGVIELSDAVAIHPYTGSNQLPYPPLLPPEDSANTNGSLISFIKSVINILGIEKNIPVYITEMGWPSDPTSPQNFVSEEKQAEFLIRAFLISSMFGVKIFCVYTLKDLPDEFYTPLPAERYFGITKKDLSPKKSFSALKFVSQNLKGKKYIGDMKINLPENANQTSSDEEGKIIFSPVFEDEKEYLVFIWATKSTGEEILSPFDIKIPSKSKAFSIYGEEIPAKDGYISISSNPVIIKITKE